MNPKLKSSTGRKVLDMATTNGVAIGHLSLITDGIKMARDEGWITDEEAKIEVRAILPQTRAADNRKARAASLRKQADSLDEEVGNDYDEED
jgi:hypothetical protein